MVEVDKLLGYLPGFLALSLVATWFFFAIFWEWLPQSWRDFMDSLDEKGPVATLKERFWRKCG